MKNTRAVPLVIKGQIQPKLFASEDGKIFRRYKSGKTSIINGSLNKDGYRVSKINGCHIRHNRVILESFVGCPDYELEANHKNGDKQDNRPENLEWVTRLENMKHYMTQLNPEKFIPEEELMEIFDMRDKLQMSFAAIGRLFGVRRWVIHNIYTGKKRPYLRQRHYGERA